MIAGQRQYWRDGLFATAAALMLTLPLLGMGARNFDAAMEKRPPAPAPAWPRRARDMPQALAALQAYAQDHYGWRQALLAARAQAYVRLFGLSPSPSVVMGRHGWLFYAGDRSIEDYEGRGGLTEADLRAWADLLTARHAALAAKGVRYYFVVAANKQSIYPEFMARNLPRAAQNNWDRLLAMLGQLPGGVPAWVIDTRPALRAAKAQGQLYHRIDVHWNALGAYVAEQAVAARLSQDGVRLAPLALRQADFGVEAPRQWDLASLMGFAAPPYAAPTLGYAGPALPCAATQPAVPGLRLPAGSPPARASDCPANAQAARALVFGDSMMVGVQPFLSSQLRAGVFIAGKPATAELVEDAAAVRAEVVIEERVERQIAIYPPHG